MASISTWQKQLITLILITLILVPIGGVGFVMMNRDNQFNSERVSTSDTSPDVDLSSLPQIDYKALNQSWYDNDLDMLIIVPNGSESFRSAIEPLAEWKNQKGVNTLILSNYTLYGEPEDDNQTKIRKMIKSYYESDGIRWVLLAGDAQEDLIPIRYVHNPDLIDLGNIDTEPIGSEYFKPTDFYYADLTGTWDSDGDGDYGESAKYNANGEDEIDWSPEVYVGRFPANDANELSIMVNKTLKYEKNPKIGDWMNNMLLAGGVSENSGDGEDEARLTTYIWQNYVEEQMNFTHLCRTSPYYTAPEPKEPLDSTSFIGEFNEGYSAVIFAGHGGFRGAPTYDNIYNDAFGYIYSTSEAEDCKNNYYPSLVYADACVTSCYDIESGNKGNDDSIGEVLIKDINGGSIGYVGAMRLSLYYQNDLELEALNRGNAKLFWKVFFDDKTYQQGKTLYDSKMAYMNSHYYKYERNLDHEQAERKQLLTYNLLGDPEVDIYTSIPGKIEMNPFTSELYEGQMVNLTIRDNYSRPVVNPQLHIYNEDKGISRTVYGDNSGNIKFRLPLVSNITYNVSISGHNLSGLSNFTFNVLPDNESPVIRSTELKTTRPSVSTNLHFQINTSDDASGIESVFVLFSTNNFDSYFHYQITNAFDEDETFFELETKKFEPGTYKYLIYTRDYTNKSTFLYDSSFQIHIVVPISYYILIGSVIGIGCIATAFGVLYFRNIKHYPERLRKLQRAQS